mmetsp:Transcript_886/g.954  ORF Transcript_886/g.954 Transcript_886/m.954 type:complete len:206 (+) Transcript_886:2-619(+)
MKLLTISALLMILSYVCPTTQAFSPAPVRQQNLMTSSGHVDMKLDKRSSSTHLEAGLFGNLFGKKEEPVDPSAPSRIMDIKCDSIKSGGLRFALGLFLIGQQGTPVKGSWKANQADDGVLDMYYVDNSAMFSLHLTDNLIFVDRYGQPSLQYLLQESLVLHQLLDEINTLAFEGEDIENINRLVVLSDPDTWLDDARSKLPARSE